MTTTKSPSIATRNLEVTSPEGARILSEVNLQIDGGEFVVILGANGAGKSTLLKALIKRQKFAGDIEIDGLNICDLSYKEIARHIAYFPQQVSFEANFSVIEFISLARYPQESYSQKKFARGNSLAHLAVERAISIASINELRDRKIYTISGGERQKVILASLIAQESPILLLDEPINNLDPQCALEVLQILKYLALEQKKTVVVVLHDTLAASFADRIIGIKSGKIAFDGSKEEYLTKENLAKLYNTEPEYFRNCNTSNYLPLPDNFRFEPNETEARIYSQVGDTVNKPYNLSLAVICCLVIIIAASLIGGTKIEFDQILVTDSAHHFLYWSLRTPRTLLAFICGAGLGICGLVFQSIFRNPLASPYTLGVAASSSLGAVIYILLGWHFTTWFGEGISLFAFCGALLSIIAVYSFSRVRKEDGNTSMLLAGVALSFFCTSLIMLAQHLGSFSQAIQSMHWLMGSLQTIGYNDLLQTAIFVLVGVLITSMHLPELDLISCGEDTAYARGVDVRRVCGLLFVAVSLVVAGVVAIAGPIGFVGIIIPHFCRFFLGVKHRHIFPVVILVGGTFLAVCDSISRTILAPSEIPIGIITALIGSPFFLWILFRNRFRH